MFIFCCCCRSDDPPPFHRPPWIHHHSTLIHQISRLTNVSSSPCSRERSRPATADCLDPSQACDQLNHVAHQKTRREVVRSLPAAHAHKGQES